jgi:diguanylate cyclase (GGDEF)-like protein
MLDYSVDELLKMGLADLTPKDKLPKVLAQFKELVASGALRTEFRLQRKDGVLVPIEMNACVLPDGSVFGSCRDISARKRLEAEVHQMAFHDALTNLPNRRLLRNRLTQTMAASKRGGWRGAMMFLDLDNFKPLNDLHGHEIGDLLLIEVAKRLTRCVREIDTVARLGGDEFVVMLSHLQADHAASRAQALHIAEKIRLALASPYQLTFKHGDFQGKVVTHHCTASIGVALFFNHEASEDDILSRADAAMYAAKEAGRNVIRFHPE